MWAVSRVCAAGSRGCRPSPPALWHGRQSPLPSPPPGAPTPPSAGSDGTQALRRAVLAHWEKGGRLRSPRSGCLRLWPCQPHLHFGADRDPAAPPRRALGLHSEPPGLPTRRGARCSLRARRTKPSGPPSLRVPAAPCSPFPGLPEGCGGHASPACPGRRGAGTRAARRTAPTPARAAPQLWLCETRPQWCASGSRRWCEPESTSWRRERGLARLCLPLRSGRRAPPGPLLQRLRLSAGGRRARTQMRETDQMPGPHRRRRLLTRAPARSWEGKETGTRRRGRRHRSPRLTNRKKPCLRCTECLLIEL